MEGYPPILGPALCWVSVLCLPITPSNKTRQMIIIVGGEPDVHGAAWYAKQEGGVYARP